MPPVPAEPPTAPERVQSADSSDASKVALFNDESMRVSPVTLAVFRTRLTATAPAIATEPVVKDPSTAAAQEEDLLALTAFNAEAANLLVFLKRMSAVLLVFITKTAAPSPTPSPKFNPAFPATFTVVALFLESKETVPSEDKMLLSIVVSAF